MSILDIEQEMDKLQREFHALPEQVDAAVASSLRKTGTWLKNRIKRDVAKKHRIPQKSIADRFYVSKVPYGGDQVRVWVGTWAIDPFSIGTPVQTATGVNVRRGHNYRGAFLAKIYSGREKVWIRLRSKHYSAELYPTTHRAGNRGALTDPSLKHRFPVVRAAIPIDDDVERIAELYESEIDAEFIKKFRQELNYQTRVKGILR